VDEITKLKSEFYDALKARDVADAKLRNLAQRIEAMTEEIPETEKADVN
jgi:hypothetical protein